MGDKVIYAVPGVPSEMREMLERSVLPDLVRRSGENAIIRSRFLRVWGMTESKVAEVVGPRVTALEGTSTTIAFLASATEGVRVRITARATGDGAETAVLHALDAEQAELKALLGEAVGGVDDEGLEVVVGRLLAYARASPGRRRVADRRACCRLGSPQSLARADWFAGAVVSYGEDVKRALLGVGPGPVVSAQAAGEMA